MAGWLRAEFSPFNLAQLFVTNAHNGPASERIDLPGQRLRQTPKTPTTDSPTSLVASPATTIPQGPGPACGEDVLQAGPFGPSAEPVVTSLPAIVLFGITLQNVPLATT